ncbi:MAG: hypothetical protein WCO06_06025 [Candidatus Roizmanbacteria bacterium]
MKSSKKVILGISILFVFITCFFAINEIGRYKKIHDTKLDIEIAHVNMVKASLNLYYAVHGSYPYNVEIMLRDLEKDVTEGRVQTEISEGIDTTKKAIKELKDFDFRLRGDGQVYQISYTDFEENKKIVEGNYNKEFH